jgi:hypothetical protein
MDQEWTDTTVALNFYNLVIGAESATNPRVNLNFLGVIRHKKYCTYLLREEISCVRTGARPQGGISRGKFTFPHTLGKYLTIYLHIHTAAQQKRHRRIM